MDLSSITLDQLDVFVAVAESGSFSEAARRVHRVQSAVSYNVKMLEEHLGVELFERSTRRVEITAAGRVLLEEARAVRLDVLRLQTVARQFAGGTEAQVRVSIDPTFPLQRFAKIAVKFAERFPGTQMEVRTRVVGEAIRDLLDGLADIGISAMVSAPPEIVVRPCGHAPTVAVVAPDHPLAAAEGSISKETLERHVQCVLRDAGRLTQGRSFHVISPRSWGFADVPSRLAFVVAGIGWGRFAKTDVADELAAGRLVEITLATGDTPPLSLSVAHALERPLGPAGMWLVEEVVQTGRDLFG